MKKILAVVVTLITLGVGSAAWTFIIRGAVLAQTVPPPQTYIPTGFQQLTPTAATALTPPQASRMAILCAAIAAVSWRDDGVAPTAAIGMNLAAGNCMVYAGTQLTAFQAISATGVLNVSYYR